MEIEGQFGFVKALQTRFRFLVFLPALDAGKEVIGTRFFRRLI